VTASPRLFRPLPSRVVHRLLTLLGPPPELDIRPPLAVQCIVPPLGLDRPPSPRIVVPLPEIVITAESINSDRVRYLNNEQIFP
jgi:hypothetical protein